PCPESGPSEENQPCSGSISGLPVAAPVPGAPTRLPQLVVVLSGVLELVLASCPHAKHHLVEGLVEPVVIAAVRGQLGIRVGRPDGRDRAHGLTAGAKEADSWRSVALRTAVFEPMPQLLNRRALVFRAGLPPDAPKAHFLGDRGPNSASFRPNLRIRWPREARTALGVVPLAGVVLDSVDFLRHFGGVEALEVEFAVLDQIVVGIFRVPADRAPVLDAPVHRPRLFPA